MAFILKYSKSICNLVGFTRQIALKRLISENSEFLLTRKVIHTKKLNLRTLVSLPENNVREELDSKLYQLSTDILYRNVSEEHIKKIFTLIKDTGKMTQSQLMLLLRSCTSVLYMHSEDDRIKLAEEIWQYAEKSGTQLTLNAYNMLLSVYLSNNFKFSPLEFLTKLDKVHIKPDETTYKKLLRAYAQMGDIEGAYTILDTMKQLNIPLGVEDFNTLILCNYKRGDMAKAFEIVDVMRERKIEPNLQTYANICYGYAEQGNIEKLEEFIQDLKNQGIILSQTIYLNILHELAVNNHEDKVDEIFKSLTSDVLFTNTGKRALLRLLHKKKYNVVLKLLDFVEIEKETRNENKINLVKCVLNYYSKYESVKEIISACNTFQKKGWNDFALSYCLKYSFLNWDADSSLNLLNAMKKENIPVKWPYYWPIIIKASKEGKENMIKFLKLVPSKILQECYDTCLRVVLPNYQIGQNWRDDIDTLIDLKVNKTCLGSYFFEKFLSEGKFKEVIENLNLPNIGIKPSVGSLSIMSDCLKNGSFDAKTYVNMLHLLGQKGILEAFREADQDLHKRFFSSAINKLLNKSVNEQDFKDVLEEMVKQNMGITSETALNIKKAYENPEVIQLAETLASITLNIGMDSIRRKLRTFLNTDNNNLPLSVEETLQEVHAEKRYGCCIWLAREFVNLKKYKEAFQVAELLSNYKEVIENKRAGKLYLWFVCDLYNQGKMEKAEEAFDLGVYMGILSRNNMSHLMEMILKGYIWKSSANIMDRYWKNISETENLAEFHNFLVKFVALEDEDNLRKLIKVVSRRDEVFCNFSLCLAYLEKNKIAEAEELINAQKGVFTNKNLNNYFSKNYSSLTFSKLERFYEFFKKIHDFNETNTCRFLLGKYIQEKNIGAIENLLSNTKNDSLEQGFTKQIQSLAADPTINKLQYFLPNFGKRIQDMEFFESLKKILKDKYHVIQNKHDKLKEIAESGEVEDVINYIKENELSIHAGAYSFIKAGKIKKYLEFLNHYVTLETFKGLKFCFSPNCNIVEDKELFDKFKSLAFKCFEKGNVSEPLTGVFVTCIAVPEGVKEAEEIVEKFHSHKSIFRYNKIRRVRNAFRGTILANILNNDKLKSAFTEDLHLLYGHLIRFLCARNNSASALDYLSKAQKDGVAQKISLKVIDLINAELKSEGKNFPYPELLKQDDNPQPNLT